MRDRAKRALKRIPLLGSLLADLARWHGTRTLRNRSTEEIFTDIFRRNGWKGPDSVSGTGSDLTQTAQIIAALPGLFGDYNVRSMIDIPCGDFHWMRTVDLGCISYLGADIVQELIERNQRYAADGVAFRKLNLLEDPLPRVDLLFCRDCLVHFSFEDVFKALHNITASGSELLLTTTFPARARNVPIATGQWQPLNLERAPFCLPQPLKIITEGCTEWEGSYMDKSLGLWRVSDLKDKLRDIQEQGAR